MLKNKSAYTFNCLDFSLFRNIFTLIFSFFVLLISLFCCYYIWSLCYCGNHVAVWASRGIIQSSSKFRDPMTRAFTLFTQINRVTAIWMRIPAKINHEFEIHDSHVPKFPT